MLPRVCLVILGLCLLYWHGYAQDPNSLPEAMQVRGKSTVSEATRAIDRLNEAGTKTEQEDPQRALSYFLQALSVSEKTGNGKLITGQYAWLAEFHKRRNDFDRALTFYRHCLNYYDSIQDNDSVAAISYSMAICYRNLSDFPHMLEYLQKSNSNYQKTGNKKQLARVAREMGYYYLNLPHNPTALVYFKQAYQLYSELRLQKEIGKLLGDIGHTYLLMRDTAQSFLYLNKSLQHNEATGYTEGVAHDLWILGDYYLRIAENYQAAFECFKRSIALYEETGNENRKGYVLLNMAELYKLAPDTALASIGVNPKDKLQLVVDFQKKGIAIFRKTAPESELMGPLLVLQDAYLQMNQFDSAYRYFAEYVTLREGVIGAEKQKEIVRLETRYQNERLEDSLTTANQLTDAKLQHQLLLARQQEQRMSLSDKEKALQNLEFQKTQSDLRNEQLMRQQREKQLTVAEQEQLLQVAKVRDLTQRAEITRLNQQRLWVIIIGVFGLLAIGIFYLVYRSRIKNARLETQLVKEKAEKHQKEVEFQHKLADISLSALRSQMNPHFIFNCLNSIKLYTQQNDTKAASVYLTKFSRLIRLVLENSRNERITLADELTALELYIEMEVMRFKNKLTYSIQVGSDVESDYIEIPPLLLQPFVENAIWHGLMHKEDGGRISIDVRTVCDGTKLEIHIDDNGVGRDQASKLNKMRHPDHVSRGMRTTADRIALINQIYKTGASVYVQDLVTESGTPAGTHVCIQLPV